MSCDPSTAAGYLSGRRILSADLVAGAHVWQFNIEGGISLMAECPWRLVTGNAIALSGDDYGQSFGLPAPKDHGDFSRLLGHRTIVAAEIALGTGDITLLLDTGGRIELWCNSCGYENWPLHTNDGIVFVAAGSSGVIATPVANIMRG